MTGIQIRGGLKAARAVREADPALPIVWGGVHPTLCPDSTLRDPLCDIMVIGEGEITIIELADCLRTGGDLEKVAGIGFKRDGAAGLHREAADDRGPGRDPPAGL